MQSRSKTPALDLALFARPGFVVAVLAVLTISFLCGGSVLGQFGGIILGLSAQSIGLVYLPGTVLLAGASLWAGHLVAEYTARPVLITGLLVLVASGLVMAITASPTMALWVLVLATWLLNLGADLASTPASDTVLADAAPNKAGSVAAMRSTFGTTGYARGPTVYIALFNLFFHRCWPADAHSRGLSAQQAKQAVDAVRSSSRPPDRYWGSRYLVNVDNNEDKPTTRTSDEHHHPCNRRRLYRADPGTGCECGPK